MSISSYMHITNGRLRLKVAEVKNCVEQGAVVEQLLQASTGVIKAQANPLTGNVLIHFDPVLTDHNEIVDRLREDGFLKQKPNSKQSSRSRLDWNHSRLQEIATDVAIQTLLEVAFKRAILALL